jgi:hypothetical protein
VSFPGGSSPSPKSVIRVGEQDPDLVVVEAVLVTLQPLVVSHLVVVQDTVDAPEGVAQDTAQEDAVVVVQLSDFWDSCGSPGCPGPGLGPGVGTFPGPMVIVGHGTSGIGAGTGGG